jgi:hypothetical protein
MPEILMNSLKSLAMNCGLLSEMIRAVPGRRSGSGFLLEGGRSVLEELFLPAAEDRGLQAEFIAQLRDRLVLQQMPPQDSDFLFWRVVLSLLLPACFTLTGRTPSPFPAEPEHSPTPSPE